MPGNIVMLIASELLDASWGSFALTCKALSPFPKSDKEAHKEEDHLMLERL